MSPQETEIFEIDELCRSTLRALSPRPGTIRDLALAVAMLESFQTELRGRWGIDVASTFTSDWWVLEDINAIVQADLREPSESELNEVNNTLEEMETEIQRVLRFHGLPSVTDLLLGILARYQSRLSPTEVVEALVEARELKLAAEELIEKIVRAGIELAPSELQAFESVKKLGITDELFSLLTSRTAT